MDVCRVVSEIVNVEKCVDLEIRVGATATVTTSRRRGRPVIDGGSRGAVGVATQVAGASYVDVVEADTLRMRV